MKIAVGMSGGVDSSVAALLLRRAGHEVVGVTMKLWREGRYRGGPRDGCFGPGEVQDIERAERVARKIGIPYRVFDVHDRYEEEIVRYFRETYLSGLTPNPCVRCNAAMKFGLLPRLAREAGCDFDLFATGHYARLGERGGRRFVRRAADRSKDQSYFLYRLSQEQLAAACFPLGDLSKDEVRAIAREAGLDIADRPDSQDFYSGDTDELIGAPDREGDIVDMHGNVLGRHHGHWHYTVGKRRGLGVGGGTPLYVVDIDACRNRVIVGTKDDAVKTSLSVEDVVCGALDGPPRNVPCLVKVRSAGEPKGPAVLDCTSCSFPCGIAGVAPGQSAVFYSPDGEDILAGGIIVRSLDTSFA